VCAVCACVIWSVVFAQLLLLTLFRYVEYRNDMAVTVKSGFLRVWCPANTTVTLEVSNVAR